MQVDSFPARKVQAVEVTQTFLQRRRELASLRLSLASRTIVVPFLPRSQANALADAILSTVTTDRRPWI